MSRVFDAMGHGALDTVDTPTLGPRGEVAGATPLIEKIAIIAKLIGKSAESLTAIDFPVCTAQPITWTGPLILIGSSTGGPNALALILADLPLQRDACTIIVQHVDAAFAPGLATWLGEKTGRRVDLIQPGDRPGKGQILLAATNDHLTMDASHRLSYSPEPTSLSYRPSVDVFFNCVATHWPGRVSPPS